VSDLRFLKELGAEFERIGETHASAPRSKHGRKRWIAVPRSAIAGVGLGLSVLVVVAVVAVGFGLHPRSRAGSPVRGGGVRVVFSATALDPRSPVGRSLERSVEILRQRLGFVFPGVQVSRAGNGLVVVVPKARSDDRARIVALAAPARLEFYDWEANALTPNGKTVASQLQKQDPTALQISQGSGVAPGNPGAGSMNLYDAVTLASKQAPEPSFDNARGPAYYMLGAPGSQACKLAAEDRGTVPTVGSHCYLSGPNANKQDLISALPNGVHAAEAQTLVVPRGITVLQAVPASFADAPAMSSGAAEFFVLKDHVSLLGSDITNPQPSTDPAGNPNVKFGFSAKGKNEFQSVTSAIAHRGDVVSRLGQTLDQHFAVALDNRLITVPSIDFKMYPDGISGNSGADITAGFAVQSAQDLATMLRFGPLPVSLAVLRSARS
jgi:SecD/SecF fusion protein